MKIIELFRDSVAFQLLVGFFTFFLTQEVSFGSKKTFKEQKTTPIEVAFEQKFLEFNDFYLHP